MRRFSIIANLLLFAGFPFLSACTPTMRGEVVTFYERPLPMGETIRVEAVDQDKVETLEFRQYARQVGDQLRAVGYEPVGPGEAADLVAQLDYGVQTGPTDVRLRRDGPYAYYHFSYGRFRDPFYFGLRTQWEPEIRSTPTYIRSLSMVIARVDNGSERLFEGRVESIGSERQLPEVMPYLITALFSNFPGENGVTKVVTIEMD